MLCVFVPFCGFIFTFISSSVPQKQTSSLNSTYSQIFLSAFDALKKMEKTYYNLNYIFCVWKDVDMVWIHADNKMTSGLRLLTDRFFFHDIWVGQDSTESTWVITGPTGKCVGNKPTQGQESERTLKNQLVVISCLLQHSSLTCLVRSS